MFGKAVTTAFAFLDPSKTRNPWNPRHTPGGSSAGPAAAVAAGHVAGAIGTQTNGSVIRPAAFCGVVGFKPTKDAIPFTGAHLFSETLDQLGTFTRSVADAARLASALADAPRIAPVPGAMAKPPRFAYLDGFPWTKEVDCDADDTLDAAATTLRKHGAEVVAVGLPAPWREAHLVHRTIMLFEAATHLAALQDRERTRLSPELNAALDAGRDIARSDYEAALAQARRGDRVLHRLAREFRRDHRAAGPRPGAGGPRIHRRSVLLHAVVADGLSGADPSDRPLVGNGLPLGMQLAAPAGTDDRLLAVAAWCEARLPFRGLVSDDTVCARMKRAKKHRHPPRAAEGAQSRSRARRSCSKGGAHGKTTAAKRRAANVALAKAARDPEALE